MFLFDALGGFIGAVFLHAIVMRVYPAKNRVAAFLAIGSVIGLVLAIILFKRDGWITLQMIGGLALFALLCELYLFLFTLALASISANLLVVLLSDKLDYKRIENLYDSKGMVEKRFIRLISTGLIEQKAIESKTVGYQVTGSGDRVLKFLNMLRQFFGHE